MVLNVPAGAPKSGRFWKKPEKGRSSLQKMSGVLSHLRQSLEQRRANKEIIKSAKHYENGLIEEKKKKAEEEKNRREERNKRKIANELKSSSYQMVT